MARGAHGGSSETARGVVMSARFDTGAGAWATPVPLNANVGSRASPAMPPAPCSPCTPPHRLAFAGASSTLSVAPGCRKLRSSRTHTGTGFSSGPVALLDGSGNALVAFENSRTGPVAIVASNYYSRSTGGWGQLPPDDPDILGGVPGSFLFGFNDNIQLVTSTGGDFLVAWQAFVITPSFDPDHAEIRIARFTSRTRTWSAAQTLVPGNAQNDVQLQRIGSDAGGNALVLWTESDGMRTALKAIRLDHAGAACSAVQVIDSAVGGGAARADLGIDPLGHAIAIWQQFEGGRPDDGSRSNIAINRFDGTAGAWASAVLAETQPGNAISPRASASGGQALLGWIQSEGGANRVKALLQPLANTPSR